jgi:hypothetical protein
MLVTRSPSGVRLTKAVRPTSAFDAMRRRDAALAAARNFVVLHGW